MNRTVTRTRTTKETDITVTLNLDGTGKTEIDTGIGFFDHMLNGFARHGLFDLTLHAKGDLEVDSHHTIEDTGIVLGQAILESNVMATLCFQWMRHSHFVRWISPEDHI